MKKWVPLILFLFSYVVVKAQTPNSAEAYYLAGIELKNQNKLPEAIASLKKSIAMNKRFDSAYIEMGIVYARASNNDSSKYFINKAIAINPSAYAWSTLGYLYRDTKTNFDSAIISFTNALKTDSLNKAYWYNIAWCYNAKGEYERSIPFAVRALEIDNTYRPAYGELGHAYQKTKKYEDGLAQFRKNLAVSVVDLPIYYSGMIYTELKDKEAAMREYEELKKINERLAASLKKVIDKLQ